VNSSCQRSVDVSNVPRCDADHHVITTVTMPNAKAEVPLSYRESIQIVTVPPTTTANRARTTVRE
jgi:hypothetical protein